ncbi:dTDP-4-dehydrorhamnose 3,5-epimerase family protein [Pseudonocardia sp. T1-2H]|uniref:dTDP-4-dehydrorhamnose 3,5-epimerase family protein n=1 Tax=Pseudonocardia sp. T1-2H TaxID=3128899 RepID=UPI004053AB6D
MIIAPTASRPFSTRRGSRRIDRAIAESHGLRPESFIQDSQSQSRYRTLGGVGGRSGVGEAGLARGARGSVSTVLVDARLRSPTFGQHMTNHPRRPRARACLCPRERPARPSGPTRSRPADDRDCTFAALPPRTKVISERIYRGAWVSCCWIDSTLTGRATRFLLVRQRKLIDSWRRADLVHAAGIAWDGGGTPGSKLTRRVICPHSGPSRIGR